MQLFLNVWPAVQYVQKIKTMGPTSSLLRKELKEALKAWNQDKIIEVMQLKDVKWIFSPSAAAHHGGVWERLKT